MPDEPHQEATLPDASTSAEPLAPSQPILEKPSPMTTPIPGGTSEGSLFTPVQSVVATPPPKKSKKKAFIIGGIIAGALALAVGGSAFAYTVWYQNPTKVVTDALLNAVTAKTVSSTASLDMKTKDYTVKIEASGRNTTDANSTVAVKVTLASEQINLTAQGEAIYSANGDIYLKVTDVAKLARSIEEQSNNQLSLNAFDDIIKKIDNKWVKISKSDLGDVNKEYEDMQTCVADISKKLESDGSFRKTVENQTKKLYTENQFIVIGDSLGSKTVNGQLSLGYSLSGDTQKAKAFFKGFASTELGQKLKACNKDVDFESFANDLKDEKDDAATKTEIWASQFGHVLTELRLSGEKDGTSATFVLNPTFNTNEKITIPSESVSFSELKKDVEDLFGGYSALETSDEMDGSNTTSDIEFN